MTDILRFVFIIHLILLFYIRTQIIHDSTIELGDMAKNIIIICLFTIELHRVSYLSI